jgi:hypothetical protein
MSVAVTHGRRKYARRRQQGRWHPRIRPDDDEDELATE